MGIEAIARESAAFALPLRMRFRNTTERVGLLIKGPSGWGEFAAFADYNDELTGRWLAAALEAAYGSWPDPIRPLVPVNAIVPATTPQVAAELTRSAVRNFGIRTIKVKVAQTGQGIADDVARVHAVREALIECGVTSGQIRVDANAAWDRDEAIRSLVALEQAASGLDYVEQPCADLADNAYVRRNSNVPIAVDEGLRLALAPEIARIRSSVDILVLKAIPLGGVGRALELAAEIDIPVIVSGSLDTSIGLASGLALAAAVPGLAGPCGLGTGALFAADLVAKPDVPIDGFLAPRRREPELLSEHLAPTEVAAELQGRMIRAWHASARQLVSAEVRELVEAA